MSPLKLKIMQNSKNSNQPATIISPFSTYTNLLWGVHKVKFASPRTTTKTVKMGPDLAFLIGGRLLEMKGNATSVQSVAMSLSSSTPLLPKRGRMEQRYIGGQAHEKHVQTSVRIRSKVYPEFTEDEGTSGSCPDPGAIFVTPPDCYHRHCLNSEPVFSMSPVWNFRILRGWSLCTL